MISWIWHRFWLKSNSLSFSTFTEFQLCRLINTFNVMHILLILIITKWQKNNSSCLLFSKSYNVASENQWSCNAAVISFFILYIEIMILFSSMFLMFLQNMYDMKMHTSFVMHFWFIHLSFNFFESTSMNITRIMLCVKFSVASSLFIISSHHYFILWCIFKIISSSLSIDSFAKTANFYILFCFLSLNRLKTLMFRCFMIAKQFFNIHFM